MSKGTLYILAGIPASGKSTWVEDNGLKGLTISSDEIRKLFPQGENIRAEHANITQIFDEEVWELLYKLLEKRMMCGESVIIVDATHYKKSYIDSYLWMANKYNYNIIVVNFGWDKIKSFERNKNRYYRVPDKIIDDFASKMKSGWAEVEKAYTVTTPEKAIINIIYCNGTAKQYVHSNDIVWLLENESDAERCFYCLYDYFPIMGMMKNFDQDNHWHDRDLWHHTYEVADYITYIYNKTRENKHLDWMMGTEYQKTLIAALFHDIGKVFATKIGINGEKHFPNHPRISAELFRKYVAPKLLMSESDCNEIYNMILMHDAGAKTLGEINSIWMYMLRYADMRAHNPVVRGEQLNKEFKFVEDILREKGVEIV